MIRRQIARKALVLFAAVIAGLGLNWLLFHWDHSPDDGFDRKANALPRQTRKVLDKAERFTLLSLDPLHDPVSSPPREAFHNFAVLGKTEIHDLKARKELLRALYKGIADSDGLVAACFNPRHGISAALGNETVDLVICFECLSIQTNAKAGKSVLTTASPEPTFNRALEQARIPIAKDR